MVRAQDVTELTDDGIVTEAELRAPFTGAPTRSLEWAYKLFALRETGQIREYSGAPVSKHPDTAQQAQVDIPGIGVWDAGTTDQKLDDWLVSGLDFETGEVPAGSYDRLTSGEKAAVQVGADPEQVVSNERTLDVASDYQQSLQTDDGGLSGTVLAFLVGAVAVAVAVFGGN
jgi:hypothetical protein